MSMKGHTDWAGAGLALGRLSEAVRRSKLGRLWLHHETARVVAQLFSRGAQPMAPEDLLALTAHVGDRIPSLEESAARRFWSEALALWTKTAPTDDAPQSFGDTVRVLEELRSGGMSAGELAMEAPLHFRALIGAALPSISLALPSDDTGLTEAFPPALAARCQEGLAHLEALERDFARWRSLLPEARSDSRLEDTLVLLGTVHALTPRYVGDSLGLTRQASARLLKRLADFGIVRKATKRQRWLIYMAENAAPAGIVPETTSNERADLVDTARVDQVLEDAYAALDRAVRQDSL
ncbi:MAG: hypothetical protein AAFR65_00665 [Pseudomonadota bacterium]